MGVVVEEQLTQVELMKEQLMQNPLVRALLGAQERAV